MKTPLTHDQSDEIIAGIFADGIANLPPETPPARPIHPESDEANFLETLLFAHHDEEAMEGKTIFDFSPEFTAGVSNFCQGFREYLSERDIEIPDSPRSFGGNVYFSLSGHGCGFWDDSETEHLQSHLEAFSAGKCPRFDGAYRFEEIDLMEDENGKLDLAILPEFIAEYRAELFAF